jgi:signal transduction histidine kinase
MPLAAEVREMVENFLPLAEARRVHVQLVADEGVRAMVDHSALRQILLNLLDNAAKYGPVGQTIRVAVEHGPPGYARLSVEDEGPGVPEEERERVWDSFYRAERDLGSAITGSGIGLSVVSDLVFLQHGRRVVERARGGGARFVISFPAPHRVSPGSPALRAARAPRPGAAPAVLD